MGSHICTIPACTTTTASTRRHATPSANRSAKTAKKAAPGRYLVLIRLEWPNRTEIRPAWIEWTSRDRVLAVWTPRPGGSERRTWLAKEDVQSRIVY